MNNHYISIADNFSQVPAGRYLVDGPYSGEYFRDAFLLPALRSANTNRTTLTVNLDNTEGLGSSFLDEAFGGLVREHGYEPKELIKTIKLEGEEAMSKVYIKHIRSCINGE